MTKNIFYPIIGAMTLVLCLVALSSSVQAGSQKDRNNGYYPIESLSRMEYNGQAMAVNQIDKFMVVNQVLVHTASNLVLKDGTSITTSLINENGEPISFSDFKNYQRVKVTGYRAQDGYMFADKIQLKKNLRSDKLGPDLVPQ